MADVNLTQEEFLTLSGLGYFKEKQDAEINAKDEKVLKNAKEYADGKDEAIAEAKKAGTDAQESVDTLAGKVGEVPEGTTVAEMIADAKEEATYDDTEVKEDIKANSDAIDAINNETTGILAKAKEYADGKDEAIAAAKKAGDDAQKDVDALEEVVSDNATAAKVTLATAETATEGYLKTYVITQGTTEIGKIDIPKELVVTAGEVVVDPEGQEKGTYVKLTIANQEEPIFINVKDLVDVYTAVQGATEVQLAVSDTNEISATLVDGGITLAKLANEVKEAFDEAGSAEQALEDAKTYADGKDEAMDTRVKALEDAVGEDGAVSEQIDNAIAELDSDVSSAEPEVGKGVKVQITEVDGVIDTVVVTGNFDNAYDAKGDAEQALSDAKDYADGLATNYDPAGTAQTKVDALANGTVKANTEAIADIQAAMPTPITNAQIDSLFPEVTE